MLVVGGLDHVVVFVKSLSNVYELSPLSLEIRYWVN